MRRVISAEVTQGDSCPGISPPQCRISPFHFLPCFLWGLICRVSSRGRSQKVRCLARVQGGRSASRPRTLSWQSRAASRNQTKPNKMVPYYKLQLPCTLNLVVVIDDKVVVLSLSLSFFAVIHNECVSRWPAVMCLRSIMGLTTSCAQNFGIRFCCTLTCRLRTAAKGLSYYPEARQLISFLLLAFDLCSCGWAWMGNE
jgi:hypothetical protein